jgi:hypothetical protein
MTRWFPAWIFASLPHYTLNMLQTYDHEPALNTFGDYAKYDGLRYGKNHRSAVDSIEELFKQKSGRSVADSIYWISDAAQNTMPACSLSGGMPSAGWTNRKKRSPVPGRARPVHSNFNATSAMLHRFIWA